MISRNGVAIESTNCLLFTLLTYYVQLTALNYMYVCTRLGFREVLCFWRYSSTVSSPSAAASMRGGPMRYDSDDVRRRLTRMQWSTGARTEQICLASTGSRRSRRDSPGFAEVEPL